jgi:hypothetical protein
MNTYSKRVAVIGAGPSGLAAARYLKAHGFVPVVYNRGERLGGQWSAAVVSSEASPRANTSRVTTRFSELDYPAETGRFPQKGEVLAYLEGYAQKFRLAECLRLNTDVETVARHPAGGWVVHSRRRGEPPRTEIFPRVVVATARFSKPAQPNVAGLDGFAGSGGVLHCFDYDGPKRFAGKTVLVAGSSIAALEIACDLAQAGVTVISTARRHRSVLRKDFSGLPSHNIAVTRFAGLAGECQPLEAVACGLERLIARSSGFPAEFAGMAPVGVVFEPWIALSERYLRLLGESRMAAKPLPESVAGRSVLFVDGSSVEVDAIVFDTASTSICHSSTCGRGPSWGWTVGGWISPTAHSTRIWTASLWSACSRKRARIFRWWSFRPAGLPMSGPAWRPSPRGRSCRRSSSARARGAAASATSRRGRWRCASHEAERRQGGR